MSGGDVGSALINDLRGGHSHLPSSGSLQPVTSSSFAAAAAPEAELKPPPSRREGIAKRMMLRDCTVPPLTIFPDLA